VNREFLIILYKHEVTLPHVSGFCGPPRGAIQQNSRIDISVRDKQRSSSNKNFKLDTKIKKHNAMCVKTCGKITTWLYVTVSKYRAATGINIMTETNVQISLKSY
jgi:hypothetical protein